MWMRQDGWKHETCIRTARNEYCILAGISLGKFHLGDLKLDGRIKGLLQWV